MDVMIELIIVLTVLIGIIIFLSYKIINNKFKIINIKLNNSGNKLNTLLKEKFDLILKSINYLNNKKNFDENLFHDLLNIKLKEIKLVNLNEILIDIDNNIENYLSNNEKIINEKDYKELYNKINRLNIKISSTRKYYNDNVEEYNKLIKKFPTLIVAKILKHKEKDYLKVNKIKKLKILN